MKTLVVILALMVLPTSILSADPVATCTYKDGTVFSIAYDPTEDPFQSVLMPALAVVKKQPNFRMSFEAWSEKDGVKEEIPHFVSDWFLVTNLTDQAIEDYAPILAELPKPAHAIRTAFPTDLSLFSVYIEVRAEDGDIMRKSLLSMAEPPVCK